MPSKLLQEKINKNVAVEVIGEPRAITGNLLAVDDTFISVRAEDFDLLISIASITLIR